MTLFASENLHGDIVAGLRDLGYEDKLLEENYKFPDYFTRNSEERQVAVAAFGQTPISYETALIGVVRANGLRGQSLINQCRALGAPFILEIEDDQVREWAVSQQENRHDLLETYPANRIRQMFVRRAPVWKPQPLLRAKNIGSFHWTPQLSLFAGLLPELEEHIQETLAPLLRDALSAIKKAYHESSGSDPDPAQLFKLVFWILAAKVFHDRGVTRFASLGADPDQILDAVAKHYKEDTPPLLNKTAREIAASRIWSNLDFRNLSVEVLAQMWSRMLLDKVLKKRLSIHRTSRTIVRNMIERLPFEQTGDDKRIILEPCAGSAVFLIGAMNKLRHNLFGMNPSERHHYFINHLAGIEKDPFGVEISKLALTISDFPNPGGWKVEPGDVFEVGALTSHLQRAGIVLCNPPFSPFSTEERRRYKPEYLERPAELLHRVLNDLHPSGVIGFVLPRNIIDGRGYAGIRRQLAERFAKVEITVLPDKAFEEADTEVGLLIATEPIPHDVCRVINRKVNDSAAAWKLFQHKHEVSTDHTADLSIDEATRAFAVPALPDIWDHLIGYPTLGEFANLHRGIEWNMPLTKKDAKTGRTIESGNRHYLVRGEKIDGYTLGVPNKAKFRVFEKPAMSYLNMRPEYQRGYAYQHEWDKPKAILGKFARERGHWRLAAFPDSEGVVCYQTYIGVWPKPDKYDEWILSAILNSPVANAFVATREGKTDVTLETLRLIPLPYLTKSQEARLRSLIAQYQETLNSFGCGSFRKAMQFFRFKGLACYGKP